MRSSPGIPLRSWLVGFLLFRLILGFSVAAQDHPKNTKTRTVRGHMEESSAYNGPLLMHSNLHQYRYTQTVDFNFVEEFNALGYQRWLSGTVKWSAQGESKLTQVPNAWAKCNGSGTVKFGPQRPNSGSPPLDVIKIPCEYPHQGPAMDAEAFLKPPATIHWNLCIPQPDQCSCQEERIVSTVAPPVKIRTSATVSSEIDAVMQVKTKKRDDYWNFVPIPGHTISFSVSSNPPARFKFELKRDEVSHFPGYAMNADIDDEFFRRSHMEHLRGKYRNEDADLIFDPQMHPAPAWKQPAYGNAVETANPSSGATVTVTAMDFGAYGKLRATVLAGACQGGAQPVRILVDGKESKDPWVTIPLDKDGNLIADRMDEEKNGITDWGYKGDPGRDDDQGPKGDGTAGDGFTAFEEYRGFMVASDPDCQKTEHVRTNPNRKDIFIKTWDPILARMAHSFGKNSGLDVHMFCNYVSDDQGKPIINITLQKNGPKKWNDKTISQATPQHGLLLIDEPLENGTLGKTCKTARCDDSDDWESYLGYQPVNGPPKNVQVVVVDRAQCLGIGGAPGLKSVLVHELGHGIGINHHGDNNIRGPIVLEGDFKFCPQPATRGLVDGKVACRFEWIAVRKQQNSGDQDCPMKYLKWTWYVPPNSNLTFDKNVDFQLGSAHQTLPAYHGVLKRYEEDKDYPGLGEFCSSPKGTGINALPGDENHAGDAARGVCRSQIHVNDVK